MGDQNGIVSNHDGKPISRTFQLSNFVCKAVTCLHNKRYSCTTPSLVRINKDGMCYGMTDEKEVKKDE